MRRAVSVGVAIVFAGSCAAAVAADTSYPTKPIRLIAPFAPGGPSDTLARLLGQKLNDSLGQPVIVDNRPAAAGIVGFETVAKALPDGYTVLLGSSGGLTMNTALYCEP